MPRWVFRYVGNKTFDFSSKKKDFLFKNNQIWPKIGIFDQFGTGHAGLFGALFVGRLVVVARGLYLARHLFTLLDLFYFIYLSVAACDHQVKMMPLGIDNLVLIDDEVNFDHQYKIVALS